jgi:sec-independent protein translocase protein TatC
VPARLVSGVALLVAFGLAFWQNHALLNVLNRPLERATAGALMHSRGPLAQSAREQQGLRVALERQRAAFELLARSSGPLDAPQRRALGAAATADAAAVAIAPTVARGRQPVTLGLGEPFAQTVTASGYFALLLALPVILWQLYPFVIPALSKRERRATTPLPAMTPLLFVGGVLFGYFVVLPGAVGFLQNCNASSFDALVQARSYYSFILLTLVASGLLFQIRSQSSAHPGADRLHTPAVQAQALRGRHHHRARPPAPRHRPGYDRAGAGAHVAPLRGEHRARLDLRAPASASRPRRSPRAWAQ